MGYVDLATIHTPAANAPAPAGWGLQVRDNFEALRPLVFPHKVHKWAEKSNGNVTVGNTSGAWNAVDAALDLTLAAAVGDDLKLEISVFTGNEVGNAFFDFGSVVSGAVVNRFANISEGHAAWLAPTGVYSAIGGALPYRVVAGDRSTSGTVTVRLLYRADNTKVFRANATQNKLVVMVTNLGPPAA